MAKPAKWTAPLRCFPTYSEIDDLTNTVHTVLVGELKFKRQLLLTSAIGT